MKRFFTFLTILAFASWSGMANAQDTIASGTCGENLTWTLTKDSVLTISGSGEMDYFGLYDPVPWGFYRGYITTVIIGDSVASIGNYAFSSFQNMTSINIPNLVNRIGEAAFYNCQKLTNIIIPKSVKTISHQAFQNCSSLKSVIIGDSVGLIGNYAFANCTKLDTIVSKPYRVPVIYENTFQYVRENILVYVPCYRADAYRYSQWKWGEKFNNFKEMCVGIEEPVQNGKISIFPNPTTGQLRITNYGSAPLTDQNRTLSVVEVYDVYGKLVYTPPQPSPKGREQFPSSGGVRGGAVDGWGEVNIDISHLANGMYFLKIDNKVVKIIKQ